MKVSTSVEKRVRIQRLAKFRSAIKLDEGRLAANLAKVLTATLSGHWKLHTA